MTMIECAKDPAIYAPQTKTVFTRGVDFDCEPQEVASRLARNAVIAGVHALTQHDETRAGISTGGWTFPTRARMPLRREGEFHPWGLWTSGEIQIIDSTTWPRHRTSIYSMLTNQLRRQWWGGEVRLSGDLVYFYIDVRNEIPSREKMRQFAELVGGRRWYPWAEWEKPGAHRLTWGHDYIVETETMRIMVLQHFRALGRICRTWLDEEGHLWFHALLQPEEDAVRRGMLLASAQDAPTQEV